jgi:hypothetical protein
MKKILILISSLILITTSLQSQTYSFVLDTIQPFKCPSNLKLNNANKLYKFQYFGYHVFPKNIWTIDLGKKTFIVGEKKIKIIRSVSDEKDGWVYIEFLDPKNNIYKLGIGTEKGTNKKIVIVTTLDEDITIQKGYFGYPIGLEVIN